MLETLRNAFKIKDIRKKIIFTFLMLIVIRIGSCLPIPGVDSDVFANWFASQTADGMGFFDAITGGSFYRMSIFALNITPYITSSIIMQLLTIAIPKLEEMQRDGEEGRKKIAEITRYLTVALALIEAVAMTIGFRRGGYLEFSSGYQGVLDIIMVIFTLTAGSAVLMWIGERITEKGVGNGISIVLTVNIISRMPSDLSLLYENFIKGKTIQEMREWILDDTTDSDKIMRASRGLTSEAIAAISKIMGNMDLILAGSKMHITATCNTTIGTENVLAARLQPNHPVDDVEGVTASTLEGLSYGSGDAVIGLNPAIDTVDSTLAIWKTLGDIRDKYQIPTQTCVLSHVTTQMEALRSGQGSADLCFQSIAGSEAALSAFGVTTEMLEEAEMLFKEKGHAKGPNVMYFETGQGSELSSSAAFGADQQTMECRCYGLARHYHPFLVNTVVGFMGPEYIYDTKQLTRAALEDVFCGHLHGLPMGCDVCYTNHMPTDQNDSETILTLLGTAGVHYVMGLPQADDIMLMYQSTSYHDVASVRQLLKKQPIPEFRQWLEKWGFWENGHLGRNAGDPSVFFAK